MSEMQNQNKNQNQNQNPNKKNNQAEPDLNEILKIRREKLKNLQDENENPFNITKVDQEEHTQNVIDNFDEMEGKTVKLAGRLMSKRVMGKASFADLRDRDGKIQLYVKRDEMGEEPYKKFKKFDIGDIVGVTGEVFKTQKGEISIKTTEIILLSKSLQPLPEKFQGDLIP